LLVLLVRDKTRTAMRGRILSASALRIFCIPHISIFSLVIPQCNKVQTFSRDGYVLLFRITDHRPDVVQNYGVPVVHFRFRRFHNVGERLAFVKQFVHPPNRISGANQFGEFFFGIFRCVVYRPVPFFPLLPVNPEDAIRGMVSVFGVIINGFCVKGAPISLIGGVLRKIHRWTP